jgi:hypothetical protein
LPRPGKGGEYKRFLGRKREEIVLWWSVKETKRKEIREREKRRLGGSGVTGFCHQWCFHPRLKAPHLESGENTT